MSSLFDLFADDPEPAGAGPAETARERQPPEARRESRADGRVVWTVTELTGRIRDVLETTYFEVWIEAEISNCRLWNTGHLYFTLKDAGAQIRAVMFRSAVRSLKFKPDDGLHVVVRGRVSVYEPKGEYQLVCEQMEPQGLGALQLAFDQLKRRLQAEGVFDAARKRALPALPRKIGIVTSLDGAAIRDMVHVLERRYPGAHLVIRPSRVQGEGAAGDIARGLAEIARVPGIDVIIVGRGGGSIEDLWAFNEEVVARAIVASPVPVISAVGHESDVTIADFAADVRAPTPSAAAEIVVSRKEDFRARIDRLGERLNGSIRGVLSGLESRLHQWNRRPAMAGYTARLAMRGRHCAETTHALHQAARAHLHRTARAVQTWHGLLEQCDIRRRLGVVRAKLSGADGALRVAVVHRQHGAATRLHTAAARLESLSPLSVLGRGYSVVWDATRTRVLRRAADARPGDRIRVTLSQGELQCSVTSTDE